MARKFLTGINSTGDTYDRLVTNVRYTDFIEVELTKTMIKTTVNFTLEYLADLFYGNSDDWNIIFDHNKVQHMNSFKIGDTLRIPLIPSKEASILDIQMKFK